MFVSKLIPKPGYYKVKPGCGYSTLSEVRVTEWLSKDEVTCSTCGRYEKCWGPFRSSGSNNHLICSCDQNGEPIFDIRFDIRLDEVTSEMAIPKKRLRMIIMNDPEI